MRRRGRVWFALGKTLDFWCWHGAALNLYRWAARRNPLLAGAHLRSGEILARRGLWSDAARAFRRAALAAPSCAETQGNLVLALVRAGQLDAAIEAQRRLVNLRPQKGELHILLGALLRQRQRHAEAIQVFRWAVQVRSLPPQGKLFLLGDELLGSAAWATLCRSYGAAMDDTSRERPRRALAAPTWGSALNRRPLPALKANHARRSGVGSIMYVVKGIPAAGRHLASTSARTVRAPATWLRAMALLGVAWVIRRRAPHVAIRLLREGRRLRPSRPRAVEPAPAPRPRHPQTSRPQAPPAFTEARTRGRITSLNMARVAAHPTALLE